MEQEQRDIKDVIKGSLVNLLGNLGKLSHLFFDLIATRFLGQTVFGYFSTTWLIMNLCFIVCYFGAHRLIIDFVVTAKERDEDDYYRGILAYLMLTFLLSAMLVTGIYIYADSVAAFMNKPELAGYLRVMVWSAPFYCLTTVLLTATRGLRIMKLWVFVRNGLEPFLDLIFIAVLVFGWTVAVAPVLAKAMGFAAGACLSVYYYSKFFSLKKIGRRLPSFRHWKRILVFGAPVMVTDFLSIISIKVDLVPLSIIATSAQVAVYQIILNVANIMRNIPQAIDPILMPVVVAMRVRNDASELESIFITLLRSGLFLCVGFFVLSAVFGDRMLQIFGDDFVYGYSALVLACMGIMLHAVFSAAEPALIMMGHPYLPLFNNILLVTVNLVLDFLLIPVYGLTGAALGSLTACVITVVAQITETYLWLKIKPLKRSMLYVLLYGLTIGVVFYGLRAIMTYPPVKIFYDIVLGFLFIFLYIYLGWKFLFKRRDREVIASIFKGNVSIQKIIKP